MIRMEHVVQHGEPDMLAVILRNHGKNIISINGDTIAFFTKIGETPDLPNRTRIISSERVYVPTDRIVGVSAPDTAYGELGARLWLPVMYGTVIIGIIFLVTFMCQILGASPWWIPLGVVGFIMSAFIIGQLFATILSGLAHLKWKTNPKIRNRYEDI